MVMSFAFKMAAGKALAAEFSGCAEEFRCFFERRFYRQLVFDPPF
jgi:hypothetical protein